MSVIEVTTTHKLKLADVGGGSYDIHAVIDCDHMVNITIETPHDVDKDQRSTGWLDKEELLRLRRVINRALDIIP